MQWPKLTSWEFNHTELKWKLSHRASFSSQSIYAWRVDWEAGIFLYITCFICYMKH